MGFAELCLADAHMPEAISKIDKTHALWPVLWLVLRYCRQIVLNAVMLNIQARFLIYDRLRKIVI